jgi:hypothetical protein
LTSSYTLEPAALRRQQIFGKFSVNKPLNILTAEYKIENAGDKHCLWAFET